MVSRTGASRGLAAALAATTGEGDDGSGWTEVRLVAVGDGDWDGDGDPAEGENNPAAGAGRGVIGGGGAHLGSGMSELLDRFRRLKGRDNPFAPGGENTDQQESVFYPLQVRGNDVRLRLESAAGSSTRGGDGGGEEEVLQQLRWADVVLLCFSVANRATYLSARDYWVPLLRRARESLPPVVLVGTRAEVRDATAQQQQQQQQHYQPVPQPQVFVGSVSIDAVGGSTVQASPPPGMVPREEGERLAAEVSPTTPYFEVDARTEQGLEELFLVAARDGFRFVRASATDGGGNGGAPVGSTGGLAPPAAGVRKRSFGKKLADKIRGGEKKDKGRGAKGEVSPGAGGAAAIDIVDTSPPALWQKVADDRGQEYWWNTETDETSWDDPIERQRLLRQPGQSIGIGKGPPPPAPQNTLARLPGGEGLEQIRRDALPAFAADPSNSMVSRAELEALVAELTQGSTSFADVDAKLETLRVSLEGELEKQRVALERQAEDFTQSLSEGLLSVNFSGQIESLQREFDTFVEESAERDRSLMDKFENSITTMVQSQVEDLEKRMVAAVQLRQTALEDDLRLVSQVVTALKARSDPLVEEFQRKQEKMLEQRDLQTGDARVAVFYAKLEQDFGARMLCALSLSTAMMKRAERKTDKFGKLLGKIAGDLMPFGGNTLDFVVEEAVMGVKGKLQDRKNKRVVGAHRAGLPFYLDLAELFARRCAQHNGVREGLMRYYKVEEKLECEKVSKRTSKLAYNFMKSGKMTKELDRLEEQDQAPLAGEGSEERIVMVMRVYCVTHEKKSIFGQKFSAQHLGQGQGTSPAREKYQQEMADEVDALKRRMELLAQTGAVAGGGGRRPLVRPSTPPPQVPTNVFDGVARGECRNCASSGDEPCAGYLHTTANPRCDRCGCAVLQHVKLG